MSSQKQSLSERAVFLSISLSSLVACTITSEPFDTNASLSEPEQARLNAQAQAEARGDSKMKTPDAGVSPARTSDGLLETGPREGNDSGEDPDLLGTSDGVTMTEQAKVAGKLDAGANPPLEADASTSLDAGEQDLSPDAGPLAPSVPSTEDAGLANATTPDTPANCPGPVFLGSCYQLFPEPVTYIDALAQCADDAAHVVFVETSEEDQFLAQLALAEAAGTNGVAGLWLGARDSVVESLFQWENGSPLDYSNFSAQQPDDGAGVDCLEQRSDTTGELSWFDRPCSIELSFICERPI